MTTFRNRLIHALETEPHLSVRDVADTVERLLAEGTGDPSSTPRQEAIRTVAAVLHGRLTPTLDPDHVAALTVDALHAAGWRHVPRPQPLTGTGPGDPPNTAWRTARERLTRPEGDQP